MEQIEMPINHKLIFQGSIPRYGNIFWKDAHNLQMDTLPNVEITLDR